MEGLQTLFFYHFEESFLLAYCSLALLGYRASLPRLAVISVISGFGAYLLRGLYLSTDLPFGSHSLLLFLLLVLLYHFVAQVEWGIAVMASLLGFLLLSLSVIALGFPALALLKLDFGELLEDPWMHIALGWLVDFPLIVLAFLCWLTGFCFLDLRKAVDGALEAEDPGESKR
ncbi:MAG: hypothetical protein XD63_1450 [Thermoanaerobacterales bacterium 50_218]|nr:MAG: hypothetical protein XD63_1450 [Thermoanaerobacterales bacterium 50_218]HAA89912.1 hypothetical protein [Peptococcaceae bacterium]